MQALIADDDRVAALAVSCSMTGWGFQTTVVSRSTDATFTHGICPTCLEDAQAQLNA